MQTIKIILSVLCISLSILSGACFLKSRFLLKKNEEKSVDSVLEEVEKLLKRLEILLYALISVSALFAIISIIEGIIG